MNVGFFSTFPDLDTVCPYRFYYCFIDHYLILKEQLGFSSFEPIILSDFHVYLCLLARMCGFEVRLWSRLMPIYFASVLIGNQCSFILTGRHTFIFYWWMWLELTSVIWYLDFLDCQMYRLGRWTQYISLWNPCFYFISPCILHQLDVQQSKLYILEGWKLFLSELRFRYL